MPIHAVFFDVGETLVDETRLWVGLPASNARSGLATEADARIKSLSELPELLDRLRCRAAAQFRAPEGPAASATSRP